MTQCAFSADGKHIVFVHNGEGAVRVLDAATCAEKHSIEGDKGASHREGRNVSIAISPDGQHVVRGSLNGSLTVVDVFTGRTKLTIKNAGDVSGLTFSPDGRHILGATPEGAVKMWDAGSGEDKLTLKGHGGIVLCIAMSHDGRRIVSGSKDGTVRVWDTTTGQAKLILKGLASSLALSSDGQFIIAACTDGMLTVWEAPLPKVEPPKAK